MGHPEKGCSVPAEVSDFLLEEAAAVADIMCPNQLELDSFSGRKPQSLFDCLAMARRCWRAGRKRCWSSIWIIRASRRMVSRCCW
jgi:pyridoxine kinase